MWCSSLILSNGLWKSLEIQEFWRNTHWIILQHFYEFSTTEWRKKKCEEPEIGILDVLKPLMEHTNPQIRSHINGTLYSLFTIKVIKERAKVKYKKFTCRQWDLQTSLKKWCKIQTQTIKTSWCIYWKNYRRARG